MVKKTMMSDPRVIQLLGWGGHHLKFLLPGADIKRQLQNSSLWGSVGSI